MTRNISATSSSFPDRVAAPFAGKERYANAPGVVEEDTIFDGGGGVVVVELTQSSDVDATEVLCIAAGERPIPGGASSQERCTSWKTSCDL